MYLPVTRAAIEHMYTVIAPQIRRTPVVEVAGRDLGVAARRVTLKLEQFQRAGSFKTRGAFAHLLTRRIPLYAITITGGARIHYDEALAASESWAEHSGALPVHAFDQPETLLGQGTLGLELMMQAPDIDTVIVAVGGGGLIGGVATWCAGAVRVVGVEPEGAPTLTEALRAGRPVDAPTGSIAADSLAPRRVGDLMFPIARAHVERVVLVSDGAIRAAQSTLWEGLRVVAEPGGAAAFAALQSGAYVPAGDERVAVVMSGGNTELDAYARDSTVNRHS